MYWPITLSVSLGGLVLCWAVLSGRWHAVSGADDSFDRVIRPQMIRMARTSDPILPGEPEYLDLKASVARHAFVFAVSAVVLRFTTPGFLESAVTLLNLLYAGFACWRYSVRKKALPGMIARVETKEQALIRVTLVRDSFVAVVYAVVTAASLYVLLSLK